MGSSLLHAPRLPLHSLCILANRALMHLAAGIDAPGGVPAPPASGMLALDRPVGRQAGGGAALTMAERILARVCGRPEVSSGEFVVGRVDTALLHDIFAASAFALLR